MGVDHPQSRLDRLSRVEAQILPVPRADHLDTQRQTARDTHRHGHRGEAQVVGRDCQTHRVGDRPHFLDARSVSPDREWLTSAHRSEDERPHLLKMGPRPGDGEPARKAGCVRRQVGASGRPSR